MVDYKDLLLWEGKSRTPCVWEFRVDWPVLRGIRDTLKNALAREIEKSH